MHFRTWQDFCREKFELSVDIRCWLSRFLRFTPKPARTKSTVGMPDCEARGMMKAFYCWFSSSLGALASACRIWIVKALWNSWEGPGAAGRAPLMPQKALTSQIGDGVARNQIWSHITRLMISAEKPCAYRKAFRKLNRGQLFRQSLDILDRLYLDRIL